jgi:hypothetical protein
MSLVADYDVMGLRGVVRPGVWCVVVVAAGIVVSDRWGCRAGDRVYFPQPILVDGVLPHVTIPGAFDFSISYEIALRCPWPAPVRRRLAVLCRVHRRGLAGRGEVLSVS